MRRLDNKGNAAIILCIAIVVLLGFTAFVIDIGLAYAERTKLSNAVDAAALAAVLELPASSTKAEAVAEEYLNKNGVNPDDVTIDVGDYNKSIEILGIKNVEHFFAPVIGIDSSDVSAKAKAIIGPVKSVKGGIRPFAVEAFEYDFGDRIILKEGGGDGYHGNFKALALGGTGKPTYQNNAIHGYDGTIAKGDWISTETGNMTGATKAISDYINSEVIDVDFESNPESVSIPRDSIRLWTIPIVNTLVVNGREEVQVVNFAQLYVEKVENNAGKTEITGRFIEYVVNGEIDPTLEDTGVYGAKLSR
jgi:hypothetical protein